MSPPIRFFHVYGARDPGHMRLTAATIVSAGVLASAVIGNLIVHAFHAHAALLSMSVILSVQSGNMVRDRTPESRAFTTALLIPTVVIIILFGALFEPYRPVAIATFILVAGAAIWVRRYGPRASAIGSLSFMGYFFTLFIQPTAQELPAVCLIAATAIATQLCARLVLLLNRPRRRIAVLLKELRIASATALRAALRVDHPEGLRGPLARVDDVGHAVSAWQQSFRTSRHIECDDDTLESRVLDARVDIEEACYELVHISGKARALGSDTAHSALHPRDHPHFSQEVHHAVTQLDIVLDDHSTSVEVETALTWARETIARDVSSGADPAGPSVDSTDRAVYVIARAAIAHGRVRDIDLARGLHTDHRSTTQTRPANASARPTTRTNPLRWKPWAEWSPSSRMTLQVMIAAAIASGVGEAISASRWYWAVMTAFVIFIGATTRSSILTRAFRRVVGTLGGIVIGVIAIILVHHQTDGLIVITVLAVFCMLYFGPLNYVYSALFITIMLVSIYGLLGVLNQNLLELRLIETLSGAVIGVLAAYLILSSNSKPVLITKINNYFDALETLLKMSAAAFRRPPVHQEIFPALHRLEDAQATVDQAVSGMSAAFLVSGPRREAEAVHLMYITSRSAARLAQSVAAHCDTVASGLRPDDTAHHEASPPDTSAEAAADAVVGAIGDVQLTLGLARRALTAPRSANHEPSTGIDSPAEMGAAPEVTARLDQFPTQRSSPETAAMLALARMNWAMRRVGTETDTHRQSQKHHSKKSPDARPT